MNYLEVYLISFFQRVEFYKGYIEHVENDLKKFHEREIGKLKKIFQEKHPEDYDKAIVKFSGFAICDLTEEPYESPLKFYPLPTQGYVVKFDTYGEQNRKILSQISNSLIAQSYEALVAFMKDILIEFFRKNPKKLNLIDNLNFKPTKSEIDWIKILRTIGNKKDKTGMLSIYRVLCPHFVKAEKLNNRDIDLGVWYNMMSTIRHSITHSNSTLTRNAYNGLTKEGQLYFNHYFSSSKLPNGETVIEPTTKEAVDSIKLMCEYGFLIFKSLSIASDLDWKSLQHMQKDGA